MTDLLNIIVLGILLLGYRIKFRCLYIPQGHCGYEVQMNMFLFFLSKSPSLNILLDKTNRSLFRGQFTNTLSGVDVVQWVEHLTRNLSVMSSSPIIGFSPCTPLVQVCSRDGLKAYVT